MGGERRGTKSLRIGVHHADAVVWEPVYRTRLTCGDPRGPVAPCIRASAALARSSCAASLASSLSASSSESYPGGAGEYPPGASETRLMRVEGPYERIVGVELKGVRSGVERHRGVSGLKARDPGRRETRAGRESP